MNGCTTSPETKWTSKPSARASRGCRTTSWSSSDARRRGWQAAAPARPGGFSWPKPARNGGGDTRARQNDFADACKTRGRRLLLISRSGCHADEGASAKGLSIFARLFWYLRQHGFYLFYGYPDPAMLHSSRIIDQPPDNPNPVLQREARVLKGGP